MRKVLAPLAGGALALALLTPVYAQEAAGQETQEAAPSYIVVTALEVAPPDAEAFADLVRDVRTAAEAADLPAEFRWDMYRKDDVFYLVSWRPDMASFDDPEAFMRAFQGTPQASRVQAAMERAQGLRVTARSSVSRSVPEWSYMPASAVLAEGEHGGVFVISNWTAGSEEAYDASTKAIMAMLGEIGYPYPVFVSRVILGEETVDFAIPFDTPGNFYGQHSVFALLEQAGRTADWESLMGERRSLLARTETLMVFYAPELSYRPDLSMAGEGS
ncbi:MAG: hypothetical protein ACRELC_05700 [Gemmatimonadota bacterium]